MKRIFYYLVISLCFLCIGQVMAADVHLTIRRDTVLLIDNRNHPITNLLLNMKVEESSPSYFVRVVLVVCKV
jgi:hypothetical protein